MRVWRRIVKNAWRDAYFIVGGLMLAVSAFVFAQTQLAGEPARAVAIVAFLIAVAAGCAAVSSARRRTSSKVRPFDRDVELLANESVALKDEAVREKFRALSAKEPAVLRSSVDELLSQFPEDPYCVFSRACLLHEQCRDKEAEPLLMQAQRLAGGNLARHAFVIVMAEILVCADEFERAEAICEEWVLAAPTTNEKVEMIEMYVGIHLLREKLHDLEKLERWVRRGLEIQPRNNDLKATLAGVMIERGELASARRVMQRYYDWESADEKRAWGAFYLGMIYARDGEREKARKMFQETMALSSSQWLIGRASKKTLGAGSES